MDTRLPVKKNRSPFLEAEVQPGVPGRPHIESEDPEYLAVQDLFMDYMDHDVRALEFFRSLDPRCLKNILAMSRLAAMEMFKR